MDINNLNCGYPEKDEHSESQKKYWDESAVTREFTTSLPLESFSTHVPLKAAVLDVGCGYGRTLEQLYQAGYRNLIGLDFSPAMIQRGNNQYPHLNLQVMSGKSLDFPDGSFKAVLLLAVLTCIISDSDRDFLLSEIYRVLKPGGILCINDFLLNSDERNLQRYNLYKDKYDCYGVFELPDGAILRHHHPDEMLKSLNRFETVQWREITHRTMNGNTSNGCQYIGRRA